MSTPKVSVIVPVYNTEKYLEECVNSIKNQTLQNIEIILVDDGSKEECATLCDKIKETDQRIKVIHKANAGPGYARNSGLEIASGEYVGFIDSDDFVDLSMYETLYNSAKTHDADLVISGISFVGGNTFSQSGDVREKHYFDKETLFENEEIAGVLLGVVGALPHESDDSRYGVSVCKNIFKRSLIEAENIEFLSERKIMSEDAIFMVDFLKKAKKVVGVHGAFYCYRRNDESFSKSYKSDRFEKCLIFLKEIENHIKDALTYEEYQIYLDRLIQGYARILCSQEIMYAKEENIKYSLLKKRLKNICANETVAKVLKTYPWYELPKKQGAFAFAMKYKLYFLQKIMVLIRAR